jgi:hypothetical protein
MESDLADLDNDSELCLTGQMERLCRRVLSAKTPVPALGVK